MMANLWQSYRERISRKPFFPKSWKGWLVAVLLILALLALYTHPWDLKRDSARPELLAEQTVQRLGDADAAMTLIDTHSEGNVEMELWQVESDDGIYYRVCAWGHTLFGFVYPLDIIDNGNGDGWIADEELTLNCRFSFSYGLHRYQTGITASLQLSTPKKQFSLT